MLAPRASILAGFLAPRASTLAGLLARCASILVGFRIGRASSWAGFLIPVLIAGCSAPLAPHGSDDFQTSAAIAGTPRLFYPLDLGDHWRFHREFTIGPAGSPPTLVRRSRFDHDLVCVETLEGRSYVIDRFTQIDSTLAGPVTSVQWIRNRQDPTGLYEADVDIGTAPECAGVSESSSVTENSTAPEASARLDAWRVSAIASGDPDVIAWADQDRNAIEQAEALLSARLRLARQALLGGPGGAAPGEITRLRYPLTVGSTWTIRENPHFTSTVEALEKVRTPVGDISAYRVRVDAQGLGPSDRVLSWYGHSGLVGILVHVEIPTDFGLLIAEDVIDLEDLSIARGRF